MYIPATHEGICTHIHKHMSQMWKLAIVHAHCAFLNKKANVQYTVILLSHNHKEY